MKNLLAAAVLALSISFVTGCDDLGSASTTSPTTSTQSYQTHFDSASDAQNHCPNDTVVWVNTRTGVYHFAGERWYGNTSQGTYECRQDANAEGDRATRNGQ